MVVGDLKRLFDLARADALDEGYIERQKLAGAGTVKDTNPLDCDTPFRGWNTDRSQYVTHHAISSRAIRGHITSTKSCVISRWGLSPVQILAQNYPDQPTARSQKYRSDGKIGIRECQLCGVLSLSVLPNATSRLVARCTPRGCNKRKVNTKSIKGKVKKCRTIVKGLPLSLLDIDHSLSPNPALM
jgi:hypothetical protein